MTQDENTQPPTVSSEESNQTVEPVKRRWRMSRRGFLIGAGVVGGGLALGVVFGLPALRLNIAESFSSGEGRPNNLTNDPSAWFEIDPDGSVRLFLTKTEMGQGVHTALAQIAAEELGVPVEQLLIVQASTSQGPEDSSGTSGSSSVSTVYTPLRQAAATLREMLKQAAVPVLGTSIDRLSINGLSVAVADDATQRVSFGELVSQGIDWEVPEVEAPLKSETDFAVIGQPIQRVDIPDKVTGQAVYGFDMRLDGMKYGAILRPPTISGKVRTIDAGQVADMPGVHTVVAEQAFAGVVADTRAQARAAVDEFNVEWDEGKLWQQEELEALVRAEGSGGITIQREGDVSGVLSEGEGISAEYATPFAVQASLEPQSALADVGAESTRVWVSTQLPTMVRSLVAEAVGQDESAVEIITTYVGGGFGRKSGFESAVEAARLSAAAGVPVHVGWTRTEEMRYGYFRPLTHHRLHGALDDQGRIAAIEHHQASGNVAADFLPGIFMAVIGADFGSYRGAQIMYDVPNRETIAWREELPVSTGWWRGLGLLANVFAVESFIDELAATQSLDPLQFRLDHLADDEQGGRMKAVLQAAADAAGWGSPVEPGRARGIACCSDVDTMVAQVAEISLDEATGKIRVHRVSAAMDCGLVVNPNGARAQVEGNIIWGIGSTLIEEMRVENGQVAITNFPEYPLLTMRDAPEIETVLLDAGDGKPRGVGEPPIGPVAAAVGNAFFALTGVRLRELPFSPERVLEALA